MGWIINNWFLLLFLALCIGLHFFGRHGMHGKNRDDETGEHKGHAHAGSSDESRSKKAHSGCH